jgi:murein DD-endopeptidase MepM/ murein hydrolase activator NlpD
MKIYTTILGFFASVLFFFFTHTFVSAFQAEVSPYEISPGDAFIITVADAKTLQLPDASLNGKPFYFSSCGKDCFIAVGAVGLETKPGAYTIQVSVGEKKTNLDLVVRHTLFPTQRLTLPRDKVFLSRENLKRVELEDERLKTIFETTTDRFWRGKFVLPLEHDVTTKFGTKRIINKKKISVHRGIDIKGKVGEEVRASNSGRVVLAEELFFGGNTVILDHGLGIYTIYMHLSKFNIKPQDIMSKGDVIGFVGSTGRSNNPHLHFGVKVLNINVNPVSIVGLGL